MSNPGRVFDAPIEQNGPVPAYKVVEVEGPFVRTRTLFDEKSRELVRQEYTIDNAFMVFFPRGHSLMLDTLEALQAHGFGEVVPLINLAAESEMNDEAAKPRVVKRNIRNADDD